MLGLRTQQVILEETGVASVADPLGGSWVIESLTAQLAKRIWTELEHVDAMGGALACIDSGYFADRLGEGAYRFQLEVEQGSRLIVGLNCHTDDEGSPLKPFQMDNDGERLQVARLEQLRKIRDAAVVQSTLEQLRHDAANSVNIVPATIAAVKAYATVGEITETLVGVFGRYRPTSAHD